MSQIKIFLPEPYSPINHLLQYLDLETLESFYEFKLCCNHLMLNLPNDMWKLIINQLILPEKPIEPHSMNDCLEFFDYYITHPIQQQFNPLLMTNQIKKGINTPIIYLILNSDQIPVDISFELNKVSLQNNTIILPNHYDIFVGIRKNHKINGIIVNFINATFSIYYDLEDLYEYKLTNVYSHTDDDLINLEIKSDIYNPKFKNNANLDFWSIREIMPIHLKYMHGAWPVGITFISDDNLDDIEILCGYLQNNKVKNEVKIYKKMTYRNECYRPLRNEEI